MEDRTQIRFDSPDIDGTPRPQLVTLEKDIPIEGTSKKEDGTEFVWHKWLCTNNQYFMASGALDGMLRLIPNKVGIVLKIEKVPNPKGGYPFFQINDMNKDQILTNANIERVETGNMETELPKMVNTQPATPEFGYTQPTASENRIDIIDQKIDKVISMIENLQKLPF